MTDNSANKNNPVRKTVLCGLFIALITVGTLIGFPIATGQGYINPGDAFIHVAVFAIGGWQCVLVAAIGSTLADIILAFPIFAPGTFIIKGTMALIGMLLAKRLRLRTAVSFISGAIMPLGYLLYEILLSLTGIWDISVAIYDLPWNVMQYLFCAAAGSFIILILDRIVYKQQ